MSIEVQCPHGHTFRVKDKYAGKRGLCPYCEQKVEVHVPSKLSEEDILELIGNPLPRQDNPGEEMVHDEPTDEQSGISLVDASALWKMKKCLDCERLVPYWSKRCPHCDAKIPD